MNTNQLTTIGSNADFFKKLGSLQGGSDAPRPTYLRLNGKTGIWYSQGFNQAEKKKTETTWGNGDSWAGSILMVRWFAKEKYKEGKTIMRRTREFSDWNDSVVLLSIDRNDKENGTKEVAKFHSYKEFKNAMEQEFANAVNVAILEKKPMPNQDDYKMELWASVYVLDFLTSKVVNVKLKGMSRKAIFDYFKSWRTGFDDGAVDSISQVETVFGVSEKLKSGENEYYAAQFTPNRILDDGEQSKVREAILALASWMKSFEKEESTEEVVETHEATEDIIEIDKDKAMNEIRLEDIPF